MSSRDYAKTSCRWWAGDLARSIRGNHFLQALASYVMTCPHGNLAGLFPLPAAYIANDLGCPIEGASKGLIELEKRGLLRYDQEREVIWVCELSRHENGETLKGDDKRRPAIMSVLRENAKSFLISEFLDRYADPYGLDGEAFKAANGRGIEGASKGHRRGIEDPPKPASASASSTYTATDTEPPNPPLAAGAAAPPLDAKRRKAEEDKAKLEANLAELEAFIPEIRERWRERLANCSPAKRPTIGGQAQQLRDALEGLRAGWPVEHVLAALRKAAAGGYTGLPLDPPRAPANGAGRRHRLFDIESNMDPDADRLADEAAWRGTRHAINTEPA